MAIQTKNEVLRAVCFAPEKKKEMQAKCESSSPVKITNCRIRKNPYTQLNELQINKRTKISEPSPDEVTFNVIEVKKEKSVEATVADILSNAPSSKFNVSGRVTFQGPQETVNSNGKVLVKQDAIFTDETDSVRMVLWQSDIKKIESSKTYNVTNMVKSTYKDVPYIVLTRESVVTTCQVVVEKEDKKLLQHLAKKVSCPANCIEKISTFLSCKKCSGTIANLGGGKILHCSSCGGSQLKSTSKTKTMVKALFVDDANEKVSLTIFHEKLEQLYDIYLQDSADAIVKQLQTLSEDEMMEFLLTVEGTLFYNEQMVVTAVKCKDE